MAVKVVPNSVGELKTARKFWQPYISGKSRYFLPLLLVLGACQSGPGASPETAFTKAPSCQPASNLRARFPVSNTYPSEFLLLCKPVNWAAPACKFRP